MATDQFRTGQVIDALVSICRGTTGHRAPGATLSTLGLVTVYDGPELFSTDDAIDDTLLIIGWSGESSDQLSTTARGSFRTGPIAATVRPRDEATTIACKAISQRAETAKQARDAAIAELAVVAGVCRSDPSLGINTSATIGGVRLLAFVTAGTLTQYQDKGYVAEIDFDVTYSTRV